MSDLFLFLNIICGVITVPLVIASILTIAWFVLAIIHDLRSKVSGPNPIDLLLVGCLVLIPVPFALFGIIWLYVFWDKPCDLDPECNPSNFIEINWEAINDFK